MLLAVDIGNTQVVFGIFEGTELRANWRITTHPQRTSDECWLQVLNFCQTCGIPVKSLTEVALSSVVPIMTEIFRSMVLERMDGIEPFIFEPAECTFVKIKYNPPNSVGADRICNSIAGYARFGGPLIVVDFGTATTFDVVGAQGEYLGGIIAPGIETAAAELHHRAAKLTKVELKFPPRAVGSSTETSMQAGIMFGAVDMTDGLVRRIWKELSAKCKVIATGGLAPLIVPKSETISEDVPSLVLEGLNLIYRKSR